MSEPTEREFLEGLRPEDEWEQERQRSSETVEKAMRVFYKAVEGLWDEKRADFVRMPLMSQADSTAYAIRRGLEAVLRSVEEGET